MRRLLLLLAIVCLCQVISGQKKYEMVIEKTDGTSVVIKTDEIVRTYFREIEDPNQGGDVIDQNIFGVWDLIKEEGYEYGESYSKDYKYRGALWYLEFNEDMTYTIYSKSRDEGSSQSGKWNTPKSGTFSMNAGKNELTLVGDYKGEYEILKLTNSSLKIKETWGDGSYEIQTYTKVDKSVLPSNNNGSQSNFDLVGYTWCYGDSEEDALGDKNSMEGYVFRVDGTCTFFAIYNQGKNREKKNGTYTYNNNVLTTVMTTAYEWKENKWVQRTSYSGKTKTYNVSISGNCMTWTGDDNETLWTHEGFTIDLGDDTPSVNISAEQVFGKWICYYQQWTQYGETSNENYTTNEYYIELNSDYTGTIHSGKDELFEVTSKGSGKTFTWSLANEKITAILSDTRKEIWTITSFGETELTLQREDKECDYVIIGKFKKDNIEGGKHGSDESNDPEGTVTMECKPNTWLVLFEEEPYSIYCDKNIFETHNAYIDMVDIGEVSGLADITSIPVSGWVKQTAQNVGHGYVFRYLNASTNTFTYARVYIENISPNSLASIIYIIKYQVPFVLENSDVIPNGTYGELDGDENNNFSFIVNGSYISWTHYINHQIEWYSNVEGSILTGIDYIYTIKGDKINLSSFKGAETLNYSRNGREVTIGSRTYVKLEQIVENR